MNEPTLTRLKTLVERAVRPVQASTPRKWQMWEELLAHVNAVFEEEAAKPGDERSALERTEQRFGDPAELTAQLQESVPAGDRWARLLEHVFAGAGAPTWRLALRYTSLSLLFPGAALLVGYSVQGRIAEWPVIVACAALVFVSVFVVRGMYDALFGPRGRSWGKAVLVGVASCFLLPGVTFALCLAFSGDWRASLRDVLPLLPTALLTPAALLGAACLFAVDSRAQREWACLRID